MQTATDFTCPSRAPSGRTHDLDSLAALDVAALGRLYARGRVLDLAALDGRPKGRLVAVRALDHGPAARAIRRVAESPYFVWGGKNFSSAGEEGTGVNRIHLMGRHQLFPFVTRVAPSVLDGKPSIWIDYELRDNPALIRAIHDEVREIDDGLYLGPTLWKTASGPKLVLWFALDTRAQAAPIGTKAAQA